MSVNTSLDFGKNIPKIIDCFIFYNELDMLEYRLSILYDVVDYFVICEASRTFVGKPKPYFYNENKERFSRYADKIIHVMMTDDNTQWRYSSKNIRRYNIWRYNSKNMTANDVWRNEITQRNGISRGIKILSSNRLISDKDLITICDLDEIPNLEVLKELQNGNILMNSEGGVNIEMDFYYYNLKTLSSEKWTSSKIVTFNTFKTKFSGWPQLIRNYNFNMTLRKGGWHLSYFGNETFIKNKIENFGHQELNVKEYTDVEKIRERMLNNKDLYDQNVDYRFIPFEENNFLPPNWNNHPCLYLQI